MNKQFIFTDHEVESPPEARDGLIELVSSVILRELLEREREFYKD